MTRKQFQEYASKAKPGDKFDIAKASGWERFKGWCDHYWIRAVFISFDGKDAVFENKMSSMKIYVTYRSIKLGEVKVVWDINNVFELNKPIDLSRKNIVEMYKAGELKHY